jgi:YjbE family integral membrane protein
VDLSGFRHLLGNWQFIASVISIIFINIVLSGDNAVVIAMAVRALPKMQRIRGIALGSAAAVVLRIILTFFAAKLLLMNYVKLAGGAFIIWIAVKLLLEGSPDEHMDKQANSLWHAMWIILMADVTMSLDNVLAIAGASRGNLFLLVFGLVLSIPIVVFSSHLLSILISKYPVVLYLGAALLGRVGGEMMITDPVIVGALKPNEFTQYALQGFCTVGVVFAAKLWSKKKLESRKTAGAKGSLF